MLPALPKPRRRHGVRQGQNCSAKAVPYPAGSSTPREAERRSPNQLARTLPNGLHGVKAPLGESSGVIRRTRSWRTIGNWTPPASGMLGLGTTAPLVEWPPH